MTSTVRAYYNGTAFVPITPLPYQTGKVFVLSIKREEALSDEISDKIQSFKQITSNLNKLQESEPLTDEFDRILS
ncbi:MAG: hypothetical protein LBR84_11275, partial [Tannerella sp.]|nr:hypothetical protein [Tannerella sp.]